MASPLPSDPIELALAPLDRVRLWTLRWTMPLSSRLAGAREARVALVGVSVIVFAAIASLLAPLWLLALGPIVLGVPHLLADVRYCVLRPSWQRERALWLTAGVPLLAIGLGAGFEIGLLGVAASALALPGDCQERFAPAGRATADRRRDHFRSSQVRLSGECRHSRRRAAVAAGALGLAAVAWRFDTLTDLCLAHLHNFIAIGLWAAWRPRSSKLHMIPLTLFGLACGALLLGFGDLAWSRGAPGLPEGLDRSSHLATLAPGIAAPWASRLVLLYCFAQAVHYGVWLRMVPEDDRDRPTPRSFRASYQALRADLHPWLLVGFALATAGLAIWACVDLVEARIGYFRFARFHGMLELLAVGLLIIHGRRREPGSPR
ncbi:MAG: hypothetical protein R6X02_04900 [Enhygromyxa sp.]